jgi:hypothetical protein
LLLAGLAALWFFALWTLVTLFADGLSAVDVVSMVLIAAILLITPVAAWALLEEANARYRVEPDGIHYTSLGGIDIKYLWANLGHDRTVGPKGLARFLIGHPDEVAETPVEATDREEHTIVYAAHRASITTRSPVARILHNMAFGDTFRIPADLGGREELLRQVELHRAGFRAEGTPTP